jgi:preprotein translocase subunit SecA
MAHASLSLGSAWRGPWPERAEDERVQAPFSFSAFLPGRRVPCAMKRHAEFVRLTARARREMVASGAAIDVVALRQRLARPTPSDADLAVVFAGVAEIFRQVKGFAAFDTQLVAARALLDGRFVEMHTGEGKTLSAALAACVAALAGLPVHLLTANDYLVARDAEWLAPVAERLGLRVGHVVGESTPAERRAAHDADILYSTAREVVFDYLRDRMAAGPSQNDLEQRVTRLLSGGERSAQATLRGLHFAIVDEADSILLDEARTPLVLAQESRTVPTETLRALLGAAVPLIEHQHYSVDGAARRVSLTPFGARDVEQAAPGLLGATGASSLPGLAGPGHAKELLETALGALHLYERGREYVLRENKVEIVDPTTGRVAEGRAWSNGLHQFIEMKEGLAPTAERETIAQLTYQRFFPRYLRLSGLSGTVAEAAPELRANYGVPTLRVPERKTSRRRVHAPRLYGADKAKWWVVIAEVERVHAQGRPVLIGTGSVGQSEHVSALLKQAGLPHSVLNALQDKDESALVAQAGVPGCITVATNMAGRGTDIPIADAARKLGGLWIVSAHVNDSPRIDRQLAGRCARQGDPGSAGVVASLNDDLFKRHLHPKLLAWLASRARKRPLPRWLATALIDWVQGRTERQARGARAALARHDQEMTRRLSFGRVVE